MLRGSDEGRPLVREEASASASASYSGRCSSSSGTEHLHRYHFGLLRTPLSTAGSAGGRSGGGAEPAGPQREADSLGRRLTPGPGPQPGPQPEPFSAAAGGGEQWELAEPRHAVPELPGLLYGVV